jgi:hypothetical protein
MATPGPLGSNPAKCYGLQLGYDPKGPLQNTRVLADNLNMRNILLDRNLMDAYRSTARSIRSRRRDTGHKSFLAALVDCRIHHS